MGGWGAVEKLFAKVASTNIGDRLVVGAAAGAGAGAFLGDSDTPIATRLAIGATLGASGGAFIGSVGKTAVMAGKGIQSSFKPTMNMAGNYMKGRYAMYSKLSKSNGIVEAAFKAFGTYGHFAATGAIAGGVMDKDDRIRGAVTGALGGLALRGGISTYKFYKKADPFTKMGMFTGLSAASYGVASSFQEQPVAGYGAPPEETYGAGSSVSDRSRMMNANGDLVFGLHNGRH